MESDSRVNSIYFLSLSLIFLFPRIGDNHFIWKFISRGVNNAWSDGWKIDIDLEARGRFNISMVRISTIRDSDTWVFTLSFFNMFVLIEWCVNCNFIIANFAKQYGVIIIISFRKLTKRRLARSNERVNVICTSINHSRCNFSSNPFAFSN